MNIEKSPELKVFMKLCKKLEVKMIISLEALKVFLLAGHVRCSGSLPSDAIYLHCNMVRLPN